MRSLLAAPIPAIVKRAAAVTLVVAVVALPLVASSFQVGVATRIAVFALFGLAFNIVFGAGGMPSLGHAAFFGVGGYTVGIGTTRLDLELWLVLVVALVLGSALGVLVGVLTLRSNGVYLLLLTLAVAQAVWGLAFQQVRWTGGDNGIAGIQRGMLTPGEANATSFYWSVLAVVVVLGAMVWWFQRSPVGVAIVAHRESPSRLAALGYRVGAYRVAAFTVSGGVASLAGVLYAMQNRFVGPENLAWTSSAQVMLFAIIGGAAFFAGPIIGATLLVTLEVWVSGFTNRWLSVLGLTYIFTMLYLPQGILGLVDEQVRRRRSARSPDAQVAQVPTPAPGTDPGSIDGDGQPHGGADR